MGDEIEIESIELSDDDSPGHGFLASGIDSDCCISLDPEPDDSFINPLAHEGQDGQAVRGESVSSMLKPCRNTKKASVNATMTARFRKGRARLPEKPAHKVQLVKASELKDACEALAPPGSRRLVLELFCGAGKVAKIASESGMESVLCCQSISTCQTCWRRHLDQP